MDQHGRTLSAQHQSLAQEIYDERGLEGFKRWLQVSNKHSPFRIRPDKNNPIKNSTKSNEYRHKEPSNADKIRDWLFLGFNPRKKNSFTLDTQEYGEIKLWVEPRRPPGFHNAPPRPVRPIWPILAVMITISLLVALYIIKPIKRLHQDIRHWHDKNFIGGINTSIAKRKDTLGALGKELNNLSTHLYELLEQQKQLLRDVSHEFRSPMARIKVATALLKHPKSQNKDELTERIDHEIDNLDYLVEELLTLQRWQRPDHSPEKTRIDLNSTLKQLTERLQIEADQRGISFELRQTTRQDKPSILGIEKPLERALENIIRNGIRFSPNQGRLTITLEESDQTDKHWQLSIADQGPGVPDEEALSKLFDPFFRLDNARTPGEGSYGVGLAIAKEGIKINGGTITAHNIKVQKTDKQAVTDSETQDAKIKGLKVVITLSRISERENS